MLSSSVCAQNVITAVMHRGVSRPLEAPRQEALLQCLKQDNRFVIDIWTNVPCLLGPLPAWGLRQLPELATLYFECMHSERAFCHILDPVFEIQKYCLLTTAENLFIEDLM